MLIEVFENALLVQRKEVLSIVKDIEETLIQLLLPQLALRSDPDDDQAPVWTGVNVHELAVLRLFSIILEVLTLTALFEVRELSSVVVGHEQGWKIEPHGLMSKHESAFRVLVVGD